MMGPVTILIVVLLVLALLLAIETPVALALALSGTIGILISGRPDAAFSSLGGMPYSQTAVYTLSVMPMYILMGMFAFYARIPEDIYQLAARVLRRLPGGMGAATVLACAGFGAVSGSSVATTATFAKLSVGEMIRYGYKPAYATALVASGGTLGMIIPPSIVLVVYGITTGESIGGMLVAGIIPGVIIAAVFIVHSLTRGRSHITAPAESKAMAEAAIVAGSSVHDTAAVASAKSIDKHDYRGPVDGHSHPVAGLLKAIVLFSIVVLGIYGGFMTITESAGVAVMVALVMLLFTRRRGGLKGIKRALGESMSTAASTTTMALTTILGAGIFGFYVISSGVPATLARNIAALDVPPLIIVAILLAVLLPLGMVLESLSLMLIYLPLAYPIVQELGFDGIWFGILVVIVIEIGMISPPVGINVFVAANAVPGVSAHDTYKHSVVFIGLLLLVTAVLFLFPEIILWLPGLID